MNKTHDNEAVPVMINLKIDYGFKKVFGTDENKSLTIGMLRAILPEKDIVDLEFIQNQANVFGKDAKKSIYDVRCTLSDGSKVIVEIQQTAQHYFKERVLYYGSMPISTQVKSSEDYHLEQVIVVSLVTFPMPHNDKWDEKIRTHYRLKEVHGEDEMTDKLEFVFVELSRLNKSASDCNSFEEKLYHCILHMEDMETMPVNFNEQYFETLNRAARTANFTGEELEQYKKAMRTERDLINQLAYAREEGFNLGHKEGTAVGHAEGLAKGLAEGHAKGLAEGHAEGHAKGLAEGHAEGREEGLAEGHAEGIAEGKKEAAATIAAALKKQGTLTMEQIASTTGLSLDIVKAI